MHIIKCVTEKWLKYPTAAFRISWLLLTGIIKLSIIHLTYITAEPKKECTVDNKCYLRNHFL